MMVSPKDSRWMLLLSSILIVIPMVIFPAKLGTELSSGSFTYAIFEILYYGVIFFILRPSSNLIQLFQGAGLTFLFRIILGSIFGVMISIMYGVNFMAALALGVSKYLPAIILHVAFMPIVAKPLYCAILGEPSGDELRRSKQRRMAAEPDTVQASKTFVAAKRPVPAIIGEIKSEEPRTTVVADKNADGFDRAVRYIGEHHAVKLAAVVDEEGLMVGSFSRGGINAEDWAPLALLFKEANKKIINRYYKTSEPERLDLTFGQNRLFSVRVSPFTLLVLSGREDGDLLGIRLVQASDIISKYVSERYDKSMSVSPEEKYVPSA